MQNKISPTQFIKKWEHCQTCKLSEWLLHVRQWCVCLSLSDPTSSRKSRPKHPLWSSHCVPQEDSQTEWQDLISLQQGGLEGRRHIYHGQHSKHICSEERVHIIRVKEKNKNQVFPIQSLHECAYQHFHKFSWYFNCTESHALCWVHTHTHTLAQTFLIPYCCEKNPKTNEITQTKNIITCTCVQ